MVKEIGPVTMDTHVTKNQAVVSQNVLSFTFFRDVALARRWLIVCATAIGLAAGIGAAVLTGGRYQISMVVIPAETDAERTGGLQLSSLLSSTTDMPVSRFKQFQSELYTYQTAAMLDRAYGTLCQIYPQRCDMQTREWQAKPKWRRTASLLLSTILGKPPSPEIPQIGDLVDYLRKNVTVTADRSSSLTTITTTTTDPEKGKLFLSRLVDAANQSIRNRDRSDIREYVKYLSNRLEKLTAVEQRTALDNLLLTEERRLMLTEVQVAYAATPLDGPNATATTAISKIGMGLGAGFFLGILLALLLEIRAGSFSLTQSNRASTAPER